MYPEYENKIKDHDFSFKQLETISCRSYKLDEVKQSKAILDKRWAATVLYDIVQPNITKTCNFVKYCNGEVSSPLPATFTVSIYPKKR